MFERYTEKALRVIFFARYEAAQYGAPCIETEHLLFGITREWRILLEALAPAAAGTGYEARWHRELEPTRRAGVPTSANLPLSAESKRALAFAWEEADRLRDEFVGVRHLLLALMREPHQACGMLESIGITLEQAEEHFATDCQWRETQKKVGH
jgi:ATP-dependent Clp protease ATP-binding subunit ClpC